MAMIEDVFVNLGSSGSSEDYNGLGSVSLSGVRNFLNHEWPQMDIGNIEFYNPRVATDEVARHRRLTRNQAHWLVEQITSFINTLDIPSESQFAPHEEHGRLPIVEKSSAIVPSMVSGRPLDPANLIAAIQARRDNGGGSQSYKQACNHILEVIDSLIHPSSN